MLVFISDLHISDKTTGVQFLELSAFAEALPNIARQANQARSTEVTFVFLGDIFDTVRTTFWTVPGQQQAWGGTDQLITPWDVDVDEAQLDDAARFLLEKRLIAANEAIFDLWSHELVGRRFQRDAKGKVMLVPIGQQTGEPIWPCDIEPRRIYLPGNHDRIINQFARLRAIVIEQLGLNIACPVEDHLPADGSNAFEYSYFSADYKTFARHGQEWDRLNFEYAAEWDDEDYEPIQAHYLEIPIGELIAAEFSRLPTEVSAKLKTIWDDAATTTSAKQRWENERLNVWQQLNVLDDVRPMTAVVPWLFDSLSTNPILRPHIGDLLTVLLDALDEAATRLEDLPFVQEWLIRHNQPLQWDESDEVRFVLNAMKTLRIMGLRGLGLNKRVYDLLNSLSQKITTKTQSGGNYETEALVDLERVKRQGVASDPLYILYGHTHHADQVPLTVPNQLPAQEFTQHRQLPEEQQEIPAPECAVYLNTGTWRPLARQALNRDGFMRWKNLTFTLFYCSEHDPAKVANGASPTFETWTGSLLSPLNRIESTS